MTEASLLNDIPMPTARDWPRAARRDCTWCYVVSTLDCVHWLNPLSLSSIISNLIKTRLPVVEQPSQARALLLYFNQLKPTIRCNCFCALLSFFPWYLYILTFLHKFHLLLIYFYPLSLVSETASQYWHFSSILHSYQVWFLVSKHKQLRYLQLAVLVRLASVLRWSIDHAAARPTLESANG